jgi:vitamin B12 transporter
MRPFTLPALSAAAALAASAAHSQPLELDTIVVTPDRYATQAARTGSSVSVLDDAELEQDGRPFLLEHLADLPGVTMSQSGPAGTQSGFAIRGAPQQYVRVYVDGIDITDSSQPPASASLSGLVVDDLSRVEVLRGSQSALYGSQAVGGVIDITSARATRDGLETRYRSEIGSFETWRGSLGLAGRNDRGEFALNASRYTTNGFSAAEEADGNTEDDGYDTTRYSASGTLNIGASAGLTAAVFQQDESGDFDAGGGPGMDAPNTFGNSSWGARLGADFVTFGTIENNLSVSRFDIDRTLDSGFGPATFQGTRTRVEYFGGWRGSEQLELQFGADYTDETSESDFSGPFDDWIAGGFGQVIWSPSEALVINAALRQDEHSEYGGHTTGRLTGAYSLQTDTVLRASFGTGFRPPSHDELFASYGNPDFEPETSMSADMGVEQVLAGGRARLGATLFWLEIDDLIEFDLNSFTYVQTSGSADSKGVELTAAMDLTSSLTASAAYTYTDARTGDGGRRERIPRNDLALAIDGVHGRFGYGADARLVGGYFDDTANVVTESFEEDFVVVNAHADYEISDAASLYLRAENLFDAQYQTARGFSTADRAFYFGITGQF